MHWRTASDIVSRQPLGTSPSGKTRDEIKFINEGILVNEISSSERSRSLIESISSEHSHGVSHPDERAAKLIL